MTTDKVPDPKDTTPNPEDETLKGKEPSPKGKEPSPKGKEPAPAETPRTYTQLEVDNALQLDRVKRGRDWKALETERDNLKKDLTKKDTEIQDIGEEIERLKGQIDELAADDPDKEKLVKKLREVEGESRNLKAERAVLEADKEAHQERVTLAEATLREISIWEISTEYEGGDPVKLKALCDRFNVTSEEDIREVADNLGWTRKTKEPTEPATPGLKTYSGMTSGGSPFTYDRTNPDATIKEGLKSTKK